MRRKFQRVTSGGSGRVSRVALLPILVVLTALLLVPASSPVTGSEKITTVAGVGEPGYSGDGGPATEARLQPRALAIDKAGNLYITDSGNHRVRRVDADGIITTVAGNGEMGCGGDGGPAVEAEFAFPSGIALDHAGNLYVADSSCHRVRRIDTTGIISNFAGTGSYGFSGDGGPAAEAEMWVPEGIAISPAGSLYIADYGNHRVRRVDASGIITTVAGTAYGYSGDGGPATEAKLAWPRGLAFDSEGNLYVGDSGNRRVRRIDSSGIITTVAGTGESGFSGDGGPATSAAFGMIQGLALDQAANLYIADGSNHRVRRVDASGIITTVAGTGAQGFSGDGGPAREAVLKYPGGIAVDPVGSLYLADGGNHRVRKVWAVPENRPPVAVFSASPTSGRVPLTVAFDASGSFDPDGGIASYGWDFGDGTRGSGKTTVHTYTAAGSHTVTLTVADSHGLTGSSSTVITASPRFCKGRQATIVGSAGDDFLYGTPGADVIVTLAGNDQVRAGAGDDYVCLGPGNDRAIGGRGNDRIYGQAGNDRIDGKGGIDRLLGGIGADSLRGAAGMDELLGGNGPDVLRGGAGRDVLRGNAGADRLFGGRGDDRLIGGRGFDRGDGGPGIDTCRAEQRTNCP